MWKKLGDGWRRTALLNTILTCTLTAFGVILLSYSISKSGSLSTNFIITEGSCKKTKSVNTWLHLLLNACSTGILASSNFFMQVLSSPTRAEVDRAHRDNFALKIGVQSMRNLWRGSGVKLTCWTLFFLGSFPLHVIFNSAIFPTEYMSPDWNLTIAAEGFISGAPYFGPGAGVWPPKSKSDQSLLNVTGYGHNEDLYDYFKPTSEVSRRIEFAANHAQDWRRLEVADCLSQYQYCNGRVDFRDVVMVVKAKNWSAMVSNDTSLGWDRSSVFVLRNSSDKALQDLWDKNVPPNSTNSLWFATSCNTLPLLDGVLDLQYCLVQQFSPTCKVCVSNTLLMIVVTAAALKAILCVAALRCLSEEHPLVVPGDAIASFIRSPDRFTIGRCTLDRELEGTTKDGRYPMLAGPSHWYTQDRKWSQAIEGMVLARTYAFLLLIFIFLAAMLYALTHDVANGILHVSGATPAEFIPAVVKGNMPQLLLSMFYFDYNSLFTRLCAEKEWSSYGRDYRPLRVTQPRGQQLSAYRLQLPYRYSVPLISISILLHWLVSNALYVFVAEGGKSSVLIEGVSTMFGVDWLLGYFKPPLQDHAISLKTGLDDDAFVGIGWSAPALLALLAAVSMMAVIALILMSRHIKSPMPLAGNNSLVLSAACHVRIIQNVGTFGSEGHALGVRKYHSVPTEEVDSFIDDQDTTQRNSTSGSLEMVNLLPTESREFDYTVDSNDSCVLKPRILDEEQYLLRVSQSPVRWGEVTTKESRNWQYTNVKETIAHLSFGTRQHHVKEPVNGKLYT
ncbi:hypothetical protein BGZ61DRAFT_550641 [Ilyonectria robusta]|uniref:uncharacterized protein n=1 Tax=Ilyonectria robusta TaxID=1079257 RepID=UPI001E8EC89D|nr:uncharacterized protein BGZ61DRAFT_550641 [Ilyonectria robusta]KAH8683711.1 hypothetical protein BGZ61DRAFT_550641 [Ilyonectria robusta]